MSKAGQGASPRYIPRSGILYALIKNSSPPCPLLHTRQASQRLTARQSDRACSGSNLRQRTSPKSPEWPCITELTRISGVQEEGNHSLSLPIGLRSRQGLKNVSRNNNPLCFTRQELANSPSTTQQLPRALSAAIAVGGRHSPKAPKANMTLPCLSPMSD